MTSRTSALQAIGVLMGFVLIGAATAEAMGVNPIHVEMTSAGRAARAQVLVTNDGKEPMPVELVIQRLSLDERGGRRTTSAGDSFLVFPPQALLAPGASQVFRLQWVGEPQIVRSESYMIYVNQIPVRMPKGRSGVQVVMSMGVLVNVAPPTGVSELRLVATGLVNQKGKRHPTITVENPSNVHALLPQGRVRLSAGNWTRTLETGELGTKLGIGLVEPGKRRQFVLPVDLPVGVTRVEAVVEHKPERR